LRSRFLRVLLKWIVLFFLAFESLGLIASALVLVLKIAYRNKAYSYSWGQIALELALRIVIVVFILLGYLCLRKVSHLPLIITRQSALLTTRAAQSILIASIALYAIAAEKIGTLGNGGWPFPAWSLGIIAMGTVIAAVSHRKRFLRSANEELRRNPRDTRALGQWRSVTITSEVLAMGIGLYGFILRMMGTAPLFEWLFLFSSVGLLYLWRPHLDEVTSSSEGQSSLPNEAKSRLVS
jgi:hypothetical protein